MHIRRLIIPLIAMLVAASVAVADPQSPPGGVDTYNAVPTDLYIAPNNSSGIAIPSGAIDLVPGIATSTAVASSTAAIPTGAPTPAADDITNLMGCAGVGQGEYTNSIYNMPETTDKFKQDVDSTFAKNLVIMNYVMPQTAALFDQLNNYGNQRYTQFQKGCNVSSIKQDTKNQYLNTCVAEQLPLRRTIITTNLTGNFALKEPQLSAEAYAQAWEICSNQYVSNTTAVATRTKALTDFATQTRALENVTNAIQPLLCKSTGKNSDNSDAGCWQTLLIPQVRLCLDDTLGCTDSKGYSVNDPLLTMPRLFDTFRYIMDDTVIARRVNNFNQTVSYLSIPNTIQRSVAIDASLELSAVTLNRNGTSGSGQGTSISGNPSTDSPDVNVSEFQFSYLNCKQADILNPLKWYAQLLNTQHAKTTNSQQTTGATPASAATQNISVSILAQSDYKKVLDQLKLTDASDAQKQALLSLSWTSLGCTANQSVPIFDPMITASLNTQCTPDDRYAFYTMAGYDVSLTATRDIYRYLAMRLKQVYTQLLINAVTPAGASPTAVTGSTGAATTPAGPTISPEINRRLATVVKEVMIPYVESQVDRLNDQANTRGEFAKRVRQIYASKTGCIGGE